jgi:outer membrane protein OmpA-like peptidoglycan-associated protein
MKQIQNKTRLLLAPLLFSLTLSAGTYDDTYTVIQDANKTLEANDNTFMQGDFEEIVRFNAIEFDGDELSEDASNVLDDVITKIKEYKKAEKILKVTVIGHTNEATDDINEHTVNSDTYANKIQDWFRYSEDTNATLHRSKRYAEDVFNRMLDHNISKEILTLEYRGGKDLAYTDEDADARDLSNRVMVSMYVIKPSDIDSDRDGVFDADDICPATPRGSKVDKRGCPIDSDRDGIVDYKDNCPSTPLGIPVDSKGCPLDSDGDGIVDYKDSCLETKEGLTVDPHGCPIEQTLALNFKTNSDKILAESQNVVDKFAQFMIKNKDYKAEIIGHTDSIGKAGVNMDLSQRRAVRVKTALVAKGVEASRISTRGRGELEPLQSNRTKEGRKANRRIEVKLSL